MTLEERMELVLRRWFLEFEATCFGAINYVGLARALAHEAKRTHIG